MKLKQIPKDFIVDEIYNLEELKEREENRKDYFYFKLTKTNYSQIRAIEKVANILNTSRKLINFAGTKDKVGITSQIISIYNLNEENIESNLDYLKNNVEDIQLEFLGKYKARINLGDNLGNKFKITVRDLEEKDINLAKSRVIILNKTGILNFFDEQRFGYAKNSHIIGKYILKGEVENALKELITATPKENPSENIVIYTTFIKENWEKIVAQDEDTINKVIELTPKFLSSDINIIRHLQKYKNDFPGSFREIPKKIRTLYINAYQSFVFNEQIQQLNLNKYKELELVNSNTDLNTEIGKITKEILEKDKIELEYFNLKSMPELKLRTASRQTKIYPKNIQITKIENDELNKNKQKILVEFELGSGEYATNVVKQLFDLKPDYL